MSTTYFLVHYSWRTQDAERILATYPQHRAHVDHLGHHGGLRQIGTLNNDSSPAADPVAMLRRNTHSLAVFTDRAAAQEFIEHDPYVLAGLIATNPISTWQPLKYMAGDQPARDDQG
jgi:uncharacterized protein YciI